MTKKTVVKLIRVGKIAAEVTVNYLYTDDSWAPYLSVEDAQKLDDMREALQHGNLQNAAQLGRIFELTPVAG